MPPLKLLVLLALAAFALSLHAAAKPNIVVFLADDLSLADTSIHGSADARTPHLAQLAAAGMIFERAYVASPSCAPSRAALLTGLMPARNGAEANHTKARANAKKLPALFQELGYEVAAFGKVAHYGHNAFYGLAQTAFEGFHDERGIAAAVDFLKTRDAARPLCLFVGTNWPHRPWPEKSDGFDPARIGLSPTQVDTPETRAFRARYLAAVAKCDDDLGTIREAARAHLGEQTLFLFSSDHGAQWPFAKWNCYEAGLHVPLVISWPGVVKTGARTAALVSWVDLLPTLLEAAGGSAPPTGAGAGEIDGRSFLPVLRGASGEHRERIFATHSGDGKMNIYPTRSLLRGDWKFILNLHPEFQFTSHVDRAPQADETSYWRSWERAAQAGDAHAAGLVQRYRERPREELYDLRADPLELRNLAADPAHAGRVGQMRGEVETWMREQGDQGTVFSPPVLLPAAPPAVAAVPAEKKPHIIFILADDMGLGDFGCSGGHLAPTPNIDRLANEGLRFANFYAASPICSPSRTGFLTGSFPARWRITSFLASRKENRAAESADFLDPAAPTLARRLKTAGYATAHFGKWHMGGGRDVSDAPKFAAYGFDEHASTWESPEPHPDLTASNWIWSPQDKVKRWDRTAFFVDKTLDFLARNKAQPCFVNLWPDDAHTPWVPREGAPKGSTAENHRAVVMELDRQIGRLLDGLRALGIERETLVIFSADNGPEPTFGHARTGGLRGSKWSLYEGGVREPLLVRWPGHVPAGRVDETTVLSAVDLFPTLCALTKTEPPRAAKFDGEDFSAALLGESRARVRPLFWEYGRNQKSFPYPDTRGGEIADHSPNVAIREGRWKLLLNADGTGSELYDLAADPNETRNLADAQPDVARRLAEQALAWRKSLP